MHLSILSDAYVSDRLADAGLRDDDPAHNKNSAHWDGVLRGLIVLGVFMAIVALALMSQLSRSDQEARSSEIASPPLLSTVVSAPDRDGSPDDNIVHRLILRHE